MHGRRRPETYCTRSGPGRGGVPGRSHTLSRRAVDGAGNKSAPTSYTWTIDTAAGCNLEGSVHGEANFSYSVGRTKASVHIETEADCDRDKTTGRIYLHHARVKVQVSGDGADKLIDAKQMSNNRKYNDITGVTLVPATATTPATASIRGVYNGVGFIVTLADGGKATKNDTLQVSSPGFPTGLLSTPHQNVHITVG